MKILILALALSLQACAGVKTQVGMAVHPQMDKPEYAGENPLGIVRIYKKTEHTTIAFEHISSIPVKENGYGLNMFQLLLDF